MYSVGSLIDSRACHFFVTAPLSDNTGSPIPPRSFVYTPERTEYHYHNHEDDNNAGPAATQDQYDDGTQNEDDQGGGETSATAKEMTMTLVEVTATGLKQRCSCSWPK